MAVDGEKLSKQNEGISWHDYDQNAIKEYNRQLLQDIQRDKLLIKQYHWRGNRVAPFSIEPMPFERQRLSKLMTEEERTLRKQWIIDQRLGNRPPVYVPELFPKNPIRRMLATPWNMLFKPLKPFLGDKWTKRLRGAVPKCMLAWLTVTYCYYHIVYNPQQWVNLDGWHMYCNKPPVNMDDPKWPEAYTKDDKDFHDKGFKKRNVFLGDYETSSKPY